MSCRRPATVIGNYQRWTCRVCGDVVEVRQKLSTKLVEHMEECPGLRKHVLKMFAQEEVAR